MNFAGSPIWPNRAIPAVERRERAKAARRHVHWTDTETFGFGPTDEREPGSSAGTAESRRNRRTARNGQTRATAPNPPIPPQRRWRIFADSPITPEPSPVPPDSGGVCRFSENPAKRSCRFRSFCGFCRTPPIPPNCRFRQTADSVDSADFAEPSPVPLVPPVLPVLPIPPILPIPAVPPNPPISRKFDAENRRPPIRPIL